MMKNCKSAIVYEFRILKLNNSSINVRLTFLFFKDLIHVSCLIIDRFSGHVQWFLLLHKNYMLGFVHISFCVTVVFLVRFYG